MQSLWWWLRGLVLPPRFDSLPLPVVALALHLLGLLLLATMATPRDARAAATADAGPEGSEGTALAQTGQAQSQADGLVSLTHTLLAHGSSSCWH